MRKKFNILLRVKQLAKARVFYRDILGLGEPVMNSNFWIEFSISDEVSFCLEAMDEADPAPEAGNQVAWTFFVPDVKAFLEKMDGCGYPASNASPCEKFGYRMYKVKDPEDNIFYVTDYTPIA